MGLLAPLQGYVDREIIGFFKVGAAMYAGTAVDISTSDTTPLSQASPYGNTFGTVVAASPAVSFTQSGTTPFAVTGISIQRELGWLLQPVSTSGPSLLSILTQVYDQSIAQGNTAAVVPSKTGAFIATDQFAASVKFDGTVPLGTVCGINAGQPRVAVAGDAPRLKFMGKVVMLNTTMAAFQIN